jgi:[ribosomal protein S5]-alanine N-acetyltransferase
MKKIIETGRIILRELEDNDADRLAEIYSDMEVMRYVGRGIVLTQEQAVKSIEQWKKYYRELGFGNWAVIEKASGNFIGLCGLSWLEDKSDVEVSYLFAKEAWGKGYATETAGAVITFGFNTVKLKRIAALVYPQNTPSIHVIEKLGMKYECDRIFFGDKLLRVYSLQKNET